MFKKHKKSLQKGSVNLLLPNNLWRKFFRDICLITFKRLCTGGKKKLIKKQPQIAQKLQNTLELLATEPFNPWLRTHKFKGEL